jgi:carboxylesterase type B
VSHADELGYLFHTAISPPVDEDSDEMKILLKMVKMWTNFAKTGYVCSQFQAQLCDSEGMQQWFRN